MSRRRTSRSRISLAFSALVVLSLGALATATEPRWLPAARGVWLGISALVLFGAGEEISWGQRLVGWESPEWFLDHNKQNETNLHNLLVFGVNINKMVFAKLLGIGMLLYLVALPLAYRRRPRFREWIDRRAIPPLGCARHRRPLRDRSRSHFAGADFHRRGIRRRCPLRRVGRRAAQNGGRRCSGNRDP